MTAARAVTHLDLSDDETAALLRELDHLIDDARFPLSLRIQTLKAIREAQARANSRVLTAPEALRAAACWQKATVVALCSEQEPSASRPPERDGVLSKSTQ
jgi:hypothetical protein